MVDEAPWLSPTDVAALYTETWDDAVESRATIWLSRVLGRVKTVAPCFIDPSGLPDHVQEAAKGIIVSAVIRLLDNGQQGATQSQQAGPFGVATDTKLRSDRLLSVADRDELKQLCRGARSRRRGGTIRTPVGY